MGPCNIAFEILYTLLRALPRSTQQHTHEKEKEPNCVVGVRNGRHVRRNTNTVQLCHTPGVTMFLEDRTHCLNHEGMQQRCLTRAPAALRCGQNLPSHVIVCLRYKLLLWHPPPGRGINLPQYSHLRSTTVRSPLSISIQKFDFNGSCLVVRRINMCNLFNSLCHKRQRQTSDIANQQCTCFERLRDRNILSARHHSLRKICKRHEIHMSYLC